MPNEKILVVDDETLINNLITSYLVNEHYVTYSAFNGADALEMVKKHHPDLIILDVMLPDVDGTNLCLDIRKFTNAPIIFVSAKTQEISKIMALSAGGDDYITKPFQPGEMIARVKANLRRNSAQYQTEPGSSSNVYKLDDLRMDFDTYEITLGGEEINLTGREFDVLRLLVENPRKIFSSTQIFEAVWKTASMESDIKTVVVYISTIRKKLHDDPNNPRFITSVRGVGYKFNQKVERV